MRIAFRADASPAIGGGHVMRCMTLASELLQRGHAVQFISGEETLETCPDLSVFSVEVVNEDQKAEAFGNLIRDLQTDVVVFDHYGLGSGFERRTRQSSFVVVLDDRPTRSHDCDLLFDPTPNRKAAEYLPLAPTCQEFALGSDYILLRPEFGEIRRKSVAKTRPDLLQRVFVSFGMTDYGGYTERTVQLLSERFGNLDIDVAVGSQVASLPALRAWATNNRNCHLHINPERIAELISKADLAIGAAGSMSWERCCLGVPSIAVPLVDNQMDIASVLEESEAAIIVHPGFGFEHDIADTMERLVTRKLVLQQLSENSARLCDGEGKERAAERIEALAPDIIQVRREIS